MRIESMTLSGFRCFGPDPMNPKAQIFRVGTPMQYAVRETDRQTECMTNQSSPLFSGKPTTKFMYSVSDEAVS